MSKRTNKLKELMEAEGYEDLNEFAEYLMSDCEFGARCGVPAICMNDDCSYMEDMEPDQNKGWCPECETNTLASAYILMGVI